MANNHYTPQWKDVNAYLARIMADYRVRITLQLSPLPTNGDWRLELHVYDILALMDMGVQARRIVPSVRLEKDLPSVVAGVCTEMYISWERTPWTAPKAVRDQMRGERSEETPRMPTGKIPE